MNEFGVRATDEAVAYIREIAAAMTTLLGIDEAEAVGRIRHFWRGQTFLGEMSVGLLMHRTAGDWAKHIYYGGQPWWLSGPPPLPYEPPD